MKKTSVGVAFLPSSRVLAQSEGATSTTQVKDVLCSRSSPKPSLRSDCSCFSGVYKLSTRCSYFLFLVNTHAV